MNKFIKLLFLDFKILSKTKTFYLKLILFPALVILILGNLLPSSSSSNINFTTAFYSEDGSYNNLCLGDTLKNDVFESKDVKSNVTLKEVKSEKEGRNLVKSGKAAVFVHVPKAFTENSIKGDNTSISITADNNKTTYKEIIKSLLERFTSNIKTSIAERKNGISSASSNSESYSIKKVSVYKNMKPITIMQYSSIAMTVMFSILTAFALVHTIVEDKLSNTLSRIKSTPTQSLSYVLGKLCGIALTITIQMSINIIISSLCFGSNWGNPIYVLLITMVYSLTISALILCWGLAAKDQMSISSISAPILYGFSFFGGSFVNKGSFTGVLQTIQEIVPNGKAINSYLSISEGGNFGDIYVDLIILMCICIVCTIIALNLFNGKGGIKHVDDKKAVEAAV